MLEDIEEKVAENSLSQPSLCDAQELVSCFFIPHSNDNWILTRSGVCGLGNRLFSWPWVIFEIFVGL